MTPEDEAMLVDGPRRVAEVAVAALARVGALVFDEAGTVSLARATVSPATKTQAEVVALARRPGPLGELVEAVAARVRVEPVIERGLLVTPGRWRAWTWALRAANLVAVGVLVAAVAGVLSSHVPVLLVGSLALAGVAGKARGPFAGPARNLSSTLRYRPLTSVPPLHQVARAGLTGGEHITPGRRPLGEVLGVPAVALATLPPRQRGRAGGWWTTWVSRRGAEHRTA